MSAALRLSALLISLTLANPRVSAQAPSTEWNAHVLMDVGPVPVAVDCPCVTSPFTVPAIRPGWGYGEEDPGIPSDADKRRQEARDAEERANIPVNFENAHTGDSNASIGIAYLLMFGTAVERNDAEAARWFRLAAAQGHPDALRQLGHRYHRGLGVKQSDAAAAYWFHAAATGGDKIAMVALGLLHAAGRGVPQDWPAAVYWWQQARAGTGWPIASRFLGDAYACGLGVRRDLGRAVTLFREAAEGGDVSSRVQLGRMYDKKCAAGGDEVAFAEYKVAADRGHPEGQIALSELYREGRGTDPNPILAYLFARLAELRTPPGDLQARAAACVLQAARLMSDFEIKDTETFAKSFLPKR